MAGEYVQAESIEEYWLKLKQIYQDQSEYFLEIPKETYERLDRSEREDSDNHINEERLGKDTSVIDITVYKYLENRKIAYHSVLIDVKGSKEERYFELIPKE